MQAVFIVWVQKTRAYIANDAVLYINYISMLSFAPAISFAAEPQVCCKWHSQMLCLLCASCLTAPLHVCAKPVCLQDWGSVLHFNVLEWTYLVYLSIGVWHACTAAAAVHFGHKPAGMTVLYLLQVYCIGNLLQQMCVRKVGAPVFATLICVRLLASVVGEPPSDCKAAVLQQIFA